MSALHRFLHRMETPPKWLRRGLLVVLSLFVCAVAVRYHEKIREPSRDGTQTRSAVLRWRERVVGMLDGKDVYREYRYPYPNPPIQALILAPLYTTSPVTGGMIWFAIKVGMAVASFVWCLRLVRGADRVHPVAVFFAVIFCLHPVLGDLTHGNVNIFIAFLVFAALEAYRREADIAAGLVLGLAIACKVTPALFLPYFAWKRNWRMLAATLVGTLLWLVVVPGMILGQQRNGTLLESWFETMVKPFAVDGKITSEHANQSIPGAVVRLLTDLPSVIDHDEDDVEDQAKAFHNVTDIGMPAAQWLIRLCQLGFVVLVVRYCRTPNDVRAGPRVAAEFALILLGMLLFSERTWKHHGVVLMLPFVVNESMLFGERTTKRLAWFLLALLAATFALIVGPTLMDKKGQDLALTYGSHTLVFLAQLAGIVAVLRLQESLPAQTDVAPLN